MKKQPMRRDLSSEARGEQALVAFSFMDPDRALFVQSVPLDHAT